MTRHKDDDTVREWLKQHWVKASDKRPSKGRGSMTFEPVHEILNLRVEPHVEWRLQIIPREKGAKRARWLSMTALAHFDQQTLTAKQAEALKTLTLIGIESSRVEYLSNRLPRGSSDIVWSEPTEHSTDLALFHGERSSGLLFNAARRLLQTEDTSLADVLAGEVLNRLSSNLRLVPATLDQEMKS